MKRRCLWLAALATSASILSLYIHDHRKKRQATIPLHSYEAGTVHLTAGLVERVVLQWLNEMRHVHPLRVRVRFRADDAIHITGAIQLTSARRGSSPPSVAQIEAAVREKLDEWAGVRLPDVTFQPEVRMKGKERR